MGFNRSDHVTRVWEIPASLQQSDAECNETGEMQFLCRK